ALEGRLHVVGVEAALTHEDLVLQDELPAPDHRVDEARVERDELRIEMQRTLLAGARSRAVPPGDRRRRRAGAVEFPRARPPVSNLSGLPRRRAGDHAPSYLVRIRTTTTA